MSLSDIFFFLFLFHLSPVPSRVVTTGDVAGIWKTGRTYVIEKQLVLQQGPGGEVELPLLWRQLGIEVREHARRHEVLRYEARVAHLRRLHHHLLASSSSSGRSTRRRDLDVRDLAPRRAEGVAGFTFVCHAREPEPRLELDHKGRPDVLAQRRPAAVEYEGGAGGRRRRHGSGCGGRDVLRVVVISQG